MYKLILLKFTEKVKIVSIEVPLIMQTSILIAILECVLEY